MVVATVHCRPMAKDAGIVRPCATAPRPTAWRPTGRFSRAPCAPWRKEIRYVPQRGSCRWTQTPRWVSLASDPLGLPHQRGHEPLPTSKPTRETGSLRTWRPVTPAIAMASPIMSGRPVHGCPIASLQHAWINDVPSSTCPCMGVSFITAVEGHYRRSHGGGKSAGRRPSTCPCSAIRGVPPGSWLRLGKQRPDGASKTRQDRGQQRVCTG